MSRRTYTTPFLVVGMLALAGCPDDVPADTEGTTTGDTTGDTTSVGPTTNPMTTTVDPDSTTTVDPDSTSGGPVCEPVCAAGECCVGGFCFAEPAPTCPGACGTFEQCLCPAGSDPCDCEASCVQCGVDEGTYDSCLGVECPAGSFCVLDDPAAPTFGWCAQQGCGEDDCACPLPGDAAATALPACGAFDGDEGTGSCFLDCSEADAVCPEGMICRTQEGASACVWPGEGIESNCCFEQPGATGCDDPACETAVCDGIPDPYCCETEWDGICVEEAQQVCGGLCPIENAQPQYGDCINVGDCDLGLNCIGDGATFGWCGTLDCVDDMVCQPPPATGDAPAVCAPINDMTDACVLDCSMGQTCPDGMACFMDFVCVWTLPLPPGYNPCVIPGTGCAMGETCIDDGMMDPAYEVCAQDCVDVSDCTVGVPETGDAPVTCGDPGGAGANACYLDCSMGQICPDGMQCTNDTLCAWPQVVALFEDDFETGDLSAGWTLADVDGLMPDPNVAFVDAAWVAADDGSGTNNVAVSTSWYMPPGISDDWLISPAIMAGPNTWVFWASTTPDPDFPDNLEVLVSTMGNTPADFTDPPVLAVTPESSAGYVAHAVNLAAAGYANTQVYIAFRNTTDDGYLLLVDNVSVVDLP
jgi:hypothetical protein